MHEADNAYSIRSTWSCYWLDQFLTLALNILILSIFYISMDLSTNYFAHFSGCWASFACNCHYPRMLCHVFWSQVEYKIVCFIYLSKFLFLWKLLQFRPSNQSFTNISSSLKIPQQFVSFCISLIFTYRLFVEIKLVMIEISFPPENYPVKHDLVEFKVLCLKFFCCHGNKSTILVFNSIFRTTPEVSTKLSFVEIS